MLFLKIFMGIFCITESLNILELYFEPDRDVFHGVSFFTGWEKSKENEECNLLLQYFVNWVAGVKLIVVMVLGVLIFMASDRVLITVGIVLVIAIASFYWKMFPLLKEMTAKGYVIPKNRGEQLTLMLTGLEIGFACAVVNAILSLR